MCHHYFLIEDVDSLGVSPNFHGGFDWSTTAFVPGGASEDQIILWLQQALSAPPGSTSRFSRASHFYKIWDGAFSTETVMNFHAYYIPNFDAQAFADDDMPKKDRICDLLAWGVPFVPLPVWTEFILRQSANRNHGDGNLAPLRLDATRHAFYVKHKLLDDSRSRLEVALNTSGENLEDFKNVLDLYNAASSNTAAYTAVFSPGPLGSHLVHTCFPPVSDPSGTRV